MAVVFLRGMNLGKRRVTNDELIAIVRRTGHSEVTAYQASGNLVFPGDDTIDDEVIARALHSELGFEVDTFARSNDEVRAIVEHSPIAGRVGAAGGKPQIVFLRRGSRPDLSGGFPEGHEVHHIGDEVHWLPPLGLGELRGAPAARTEPSDRRRSERSGRSSASCSASADTPHRHRSDARADPRADTVGRVTTLLF